MQIITDILDIIGLGNITAKPKTVDGAGLDVNVSAGDAFGTDQNGGILYLNAGRGTGTGYTEIVFQMADPSGTGSTPNSLYRIGNFGYDGLLIEKDLYFRGTPNPRRIIADSQFSGDADGTELQVIAGSGGTGGVDHNGGNLTLQSGDTTGTGRSSIDFQVPVTGTTGNTPNSFETAMSIRQGYVETYEKHRTYVMECQTIGAVTGDLITATGLKITTNNNRSYALKCLVVARDTGSQDSYYNAPTAIISRGANEASTTVEASDENGAGNLGGIALAFIADTGTGEIYIQVTGVALKTINYRAKVEVIETSV